MIALNEKKICTSSSIDVIKIDWEKKGNTTKTLCSYMCLRQSD